MANHKSTKKEIRKVAKRTLVNRRRKNKIAEALKKVRNAIASVQDPQDQKQIEKVMVAFRKAQSKIMSRKTQPLFNRAKASRLVSGLAAKVKKVSKIDN